MSLPPSRLPPRPPIRPSSPPQNERRLAISGIFYGPPGVGKTSMFANFPRPGFIIDSQERGIEYLADSRLVPQPVFIWNVPNKAEGWEDMVNRIGRAALEPIDNLFIEGLAGIESICFLSHAKEKFGGDVSNSDRGFYSFQKGPKNASKFDFPQLLEACNICLRSGKNVYLSGHSMVKEEITAQGEKYQKNVPIMEKEIWHRVAKWASLVCHYGVKIQTDMEKSRNALKKTAKEDFDRLLYCQMTPFAEAKNWIGLPAVINAGRSAKECYENFQQELNAKRN